MRTVPRLLVAAALLLPAFLTACGPSPTVEPEPQEDTGSRAATAVTPGGEWREWAGPNGDFRVADAGLARQWAADGPPRVWSRPLGPGYSAISVAAGRLFTMYRGEAEDVVAALDAASGESLWEYRYEAPAREDNVIQFGEGPHATPLVLEDRVVTLGYTGKLSCLSIETGEVLWNLDIVEDLQGDIQSFGSSASPVLHDGRVIVLVGGANAVVALEPADGSVVWRSAAGSVSYSSPRVFDVGGQEQLVYYSADAVIGLDAENGESIWSFPVKNQYENNSTNLHFQGDLLWVATQLDGGTRALRLTREGPGTRVEEVWSSNKMSIHFWNTVLVEGHVFASVGSNASILAAIDLATGEFKWRERGFEQVNFVVAGDLAILLDAEGQLALASLSPERLEVLAQATLFDGTTWTVPTLVGTRLYVRDKQNIYAFELASAADTSAAEG